MILRCFHLNLEGRTRPWECCSSHELKLACFEGFPYSTQASFFLFHISQYAQMEVLVKYGREDPFQPSATSTGRTRSFRQSVTSHAFWRLGGVTRVKGNQNLFHCSWTTFRCLCRRWCWEGCALRWSLVQIAICVSVCGLQRVMHGDSVLSSHRLAAKAKNQLEKPLEEYKPGMELTGVFMICRPVWFSITVWAWLSQCNLGGFYEWKQITSRQAVFISREVDDINLERHNKYWQ